MIAYLDTSALVKRYFHETGSEVVMRLWKEAGAIAVSQVGYAESMAAFYRKNREAAIPSHLFKRIKRTFARDWESLIKITVTDDLNPIIYDLLNNHPLRGFDAIHLASALIIRETVQQELLFVCYDKNLSTAAAATGLQTLPTDPAQLS